MRWLPVRMRARRPVRRRRRDEHRAELRERVVTGSLSAVLWLQVARRHGARPSTLRYTLLGLVLVPLTLAATLLVTGA